MLIIYTTKGSALLGKSEADIVECAREGFF